MFAFVVVCCALRFVKVKRLEVRGTRRKVDIARDEKVTVMMMCVLVCVRVFV
jgi:hypothetical protein